MQNSAFEQEVLELTNNFRQRNGLKPLVIDQNLEKAADAHTQAMANSDFFSHTGKDGSQPWDRAEKAGYESGFVGENIAAGYETPKAVVDGWISSPGHRANMLDSDYNEIGLGHYFLQNDTGNVNYNNYWTQVFGKGTVSASKPESSSDPTPPSSTPPSPPSPTFNGLSVIKGTARNDKLIGGADNQVLAGKRGDDVLNGGGGDDKLRGDGGNDKLFGGKGNDLLLGGGGRDLLQGSSKNRLNEKDILTGGGGADRFVLGDENRTFYNDGKANSMGSTDYALITDFNQSKGDIIQLSAEYSYRLGAAPQSVESGQALFIDSPAGQKDELLAVIQKGQNLQLDSSAFAFV